MVILMVNNMHFLTNLIYVTNLICEKNLNYILKSFTLPAKLQINK